MNYKASDIKPKRYPDEKPKEDDIYITYDNFYRWGVDDFSNFHFAMDDTVWFIDIPGAPPELKPLAYPENKPEQDGEYWCFNRYTNDWKQFIYTTDEFHAVDDYVVWFIPYRLDKENEMVSKKAQEIASKEYDCFSSRAGCGSNKYKENEMDGKGIHGLG